ncbi:MAG: SDR family oxidoreductase [Planctomycetota bacterium]
MGNEVTPRVAIVTGAGGGIGREICHGLRREGYRIVACGRTASTLDEAIAGEGTGADDLAIRADLTREDEARMVIDRTIDHFGRVDVLVNNAARADLRPLPTSEPSFVDDHLRINFIAPLIMIQRVWETFVAQGGGRIVNLSSMATVDPFPGLGVYAATKCALDSLTRSIRNEGSEFGIEAWSVAPGAVETSMLRSIVTEDDLPAAQTLDPTTVADIIVACATGRRPDDAGTVILVPSPG